MTLVPNSVYTAAKTIYWSVAEQRWNTLRGSMKITRGEQLQVAVAGPEPIIFKTAGGASRVFKPEDVTDFLVQGTNLDGE